MEKLYLGVDLHMRSCRVTVPDADGRPRDLLLLLPLPRLTGIYWEIQITKWRDQPAGTITK